MFSNSNEQYLSEGTAYGQLGEIDESIDRIRINSTILLNRLEPVICRRLFIYNAPYHSIAWRELRLGTVFGTNEVFFIMVYLLSPGLSLSYSGGEYIDKCGII